MKEGLPCLFKNDLWIQIHKYEWDLLCRENHVQTYVHCDGLNQDAIWLTALYHAVWVINMKMLLVEGLINSKSLFFKILIFSEFLNFPAYLFHSTIKEGKKEFLK